MPARTKLVTNAMDEQKQMVATLSMLKQLETPEGTEYLRSVMAEAGLPMPTREYLEAKLLKQLEAPRGTEHLQSVMGEAGLQMPTREYLENLGPWQRASAGSGV
mgnify:CR=1 FL=1|tara:strand:- start:1514 stop:1825 length:312 start_codon:yes stop_codon:yes gene_type:complete